MVASEERHPDTVEAQVGDERDGHLAVDAQDLNATADGRERPADGQREDGVHADAHACVARRPWGETDGPDLEPPPRAPQEQVRHHRGEQRDEEPVVGPPEPQADERDAGRDVYGVCARDEPLGPQRFQGEVGRQVDADVVQHDRGDDLVRPEARLEKTGYGAPQKARQYAGQQDQDHAYWAEETQGHPEPGGGYGADVELALAADVEQARAEGHGHGEAREDQGRRTEQRPADGCRGADGALQERHVGRHWVVARRQHDHSPDEEGEEDGEHGEDQRPSRTHEDPAQRRAAGCLFFRDLGCPVFAHPWRLTRSAPPRARP